MFCEMANFGTQAHRFLIVDDDPSVSDSLKWLLKADGVEIETATSGKEALARMEKGKFDLIITDYIMPFMKGDKLAVAIKEREPSCRVIITTAYYESLKSLGDSLTGVDSVVMKPFSVQELRNAIAKALPDQRFLDVVK
jgi:CheY-like chemotaxis protein